MIQIETAEESTEQEFTDEFTDVSVTEIGSTSDDSRPIIEYRTVKTRKRKNTGTQRKRKTVKRAVKVSATRYSKRSSKRPRQYS